MARYFFNYEGRIPHDDEGEELADDGTAGQSALKGMRELVSQAVFAGDDELVPGCMVVTDDSGREVIRLEPREVLTKSLR